MSLSARDIVIVGLPPTLAAAMHSFLHHSGGALVSISDHIAPRTDEADLILTVAPFFISHLDYFLPRRQRVILLLDRQSDLPSENPPTASIYLDDTPETTLAILKKAVAVTYDVHEPENKALSPRETDVLKGIAAGKINKEIADELSISVNTVITHRKNISQKLGIRSVSGLSLYALMNGLI